MKSPNMNLCQHPPSSESLGVDKQTTAMSSVLVEDTSTTYLSSYVCWVLFAHMFISVGMIGMSTLDKDLVLA